MILWCDTHVWLQSVHVPIVPRTQLAFVGCHFFCESKSLIIRSLFLGGLQVSRICRQSTCYWGPMRWTISGIVFQWFIHYLQSLRQWALDVHGFLAWKNICWGTCETKRPSNQGPGLMRNGGSVVVCTLIPAQLYFTRGGYTYKVGPY